MKKTHKERQAFLDRIEKRYQEKLLLQNYRDESLKLKDQRRSLNGLRVDQLHENETDIIEVRHFTPTYS